jgi:hypothetical protein
MYCTRSDAPMKVLNDLGIKSPETKLAGAHEKIDRK